MRSNQKNNKENILNPVRQKLFPNIWTNLDFEVNKAFWAYHGNSTALSIRMMNLIELQRILDNFTVPNFAYGRTLLDIVISKTLLEDHDDDVIVDRDTFSNKSDNILKELEASNFIVIRNSERLFSIIRYERYIDIHFSNFLEKSKLSYINGYEVRIPESPENILSKKYGKRFKNQRSFLGKIKLLAFIIFKSPHQIKFQINNFIKKTPLIIYNKITEIKIFKFKKKYLKYNDFLNLKIDSIGSNNWEWRNTHLSILFQEGENLGQAIERIKLQGGLGALSAQINEVDTSRCFTEPINLSRRFWSGGNNFFIYPAMYGFRHNVIPYMRVNTYIQIQVKPDIFTAEYLLSLPEMSDLEIEDFLNKNPIEIRKGAIVSGRHRIAAMVGRIIKGQKYIEFCYY